MKLFFYYISIIMTFCISCFFSCTSDLEIPPLPPPDSVEQDSSSSFQSSSSDASSSSFVLCQIESNCIQLPEANCKAPGLVVPACNLTCELSSSFIQQEEAMDPPPVVRCNGIKVSRDIVWTPAGLTFTSVGPQSVGAKVLNCNNAVADCGTVVVFY